MPVITEQATSNGTGAATFTFTRSVPRGEGWVGTINIPLAPSTATGYVTLTTRPYCAVVGGAASGEIPLSGSMSKPMTVVITSGLVSGTSYTCVLTYRRYQGSTNPPDTVVAPTASYTRVSQLLTGIKGVNLGTKTVSYTGAVGTVRVHNPPPINFSAYAIVLYSPTVTGGANPCCAQVSDFTFENNVPLTFTLFGTGPVASFGPSIRTDTNTHVKRAWICIVPAPTRTPLPAPTIRVWYDSATGRPTIAAVFGLTGNPGVQLRSDGRAYPVGAFHKRVTATPLITAPSAPLRVLLKEIQLFSGTNTTGSGEISIKAGTTTNTVLTELISLKTTQVNGPPVSWGETGLLLPPGVAVKVGHTTPVINFRAIAVYDLVV